jgi:hypothetical protein
MLRLQIGSPELNLVQSIFYAWRGVRIPAISIGKFRNNFIKFEVFDMQEFNNTTLFQFCGTDNFSDFDDLSQPFYPAAIPYSHNRHHSSLVLGR